MVPTVLSVRSVPSVLTVPTTGTQHGTVFTAAADRILTQTATHTDSVRSCGGALPWPL